jgi:hypothetical protein
MNALPQDLRRMKHYVVGEENRMELAGVVDDDREDDDE